MGRHKRRSNSLKREIVEQHIGAGIYAEVGPTPLKTLARERGVSRNAIREWIKKYRDGEFGAENRELLDDGRLQ